MSVKKSGAGDPAQLDQLRRWARLLDSEFEIPVLGIRFGWDPIIGLIPGLGDLVTPVFSAALIMHAVRLGVPKVVQLRMLLNVLLDVASGLVPVLGDLMDVAWKANAKNLALLEAHSIGETRASRADYIFVVGILAALAICAMLPIVLLVWVMSRLF